jgi:hypothetical protein
MLVALPVLAGETPFPGENLFPLKAGNTWTYKVAGQDERFVVRAVRQEMVGEQTCMLLEGSLKDRVVATEHVAFTKDGLYRFRVDHVDVSPPLCVLRASALRGGGWGTGKKEFQLGTRSATAGFTARLEETTVLGTKYKTTSVRATVNEGQRGWTNTDIWYAEGVGIVKQRIVDGKRQELLLELEKFEPASGDK